MQIHILPGQNIVFDVRLVNRSSGLPFAPSRSRIRVYDVDQGRRNFTESITLCGFDSQNFNPIDMGPLLSGNINQSTPAPGCALLQSTIQQVPNPERLAGFFALDALQRSVAAEFLFSDTSDYPFEFHLEFTGTAGFRNRRAYYIALLIETDMCIPPEPGAIEPPPFTL